jgi:hypothetical protein
MPHVRQHVPRFDVLLLVKRLKEAAMGRGLLLWLAGVPLSVIILIALFTSWI